ncbi:hypothetical protein [Lederbergia lenta]|uniref:hypothetical protein n=1 Tax=Lederbergia lenta TaxID=1467 RepID=UPI00203FAA67|nr:hypothetical protein [Lederbergia lenta]MCM3113606.1 hypothetical protein [Lederbergia lenta]
MSKSFFQWVIEKKGLNNEIIEFTLNKEQYQIEMKNLIQIVDNKCDIEKESIHRTILDMEVLNRDLMEYLIFLTKNHFMEQLYEEKKFSLSLVK